MTIGVETFDKSVIFPRGRGGSSVARERLVALAKQEIVADVRSRGFEPIPTTVSVLWLNDYQARVSIDAVRVGLPTDDSDDARPTPVRRVGFLGGEWP